MDWKATGFNGMREHYHSSVENVIFYGLSAILVINLTRIGASWAAKSQTPMLASAGKAVGALVTFA